MDAFIASIDFTEAIELYLYLRAREEDLAPSAEKLFCRLRAYLYERLSIEEMEHPEDLLTRLRRV